MGFVNELSREIQMQALGVKKYREKQLRSEKLGQMSRQGAGASVLAAVIPTLSASIKAGCNLRRKGAAGRPSAAIMKLRELQPDVSALICARTVFDTLCDSRALGATTIMIGARIEDELRFRAFKKQDPGSYKNAMKAIEQSQNYSYQHKVLVHMMKENENITQWERWGTKLKMKVGSQLLEWMRAGTGTIRLAKMDRAWIVMPTQELIETLAKAHEHLEVLNPWFLPTADVPKAWTETANGGYQCYDLPLVKTSQRVMREVGKKFLPTETILAAVNAAQSTAYRINRDVFEVMTTLWKVSALPLPGIPSRAEVDEVIRPEDLLPRGADLDDTQKELLKGWLRACAAALKLDRRRKSQLLTAAQIVSAAEELLEMDRFYFPHQLDWRGRAYSVPLFLSPQGPDIGRGLLEFADVKPLGTEAGARWFSLTGANHFGVDKVSFGDRLAWVEAHRNTILAVAADPLTNQWWMEAKEAYQFLAWCLEYAAWHEADYSLDFESRKVVGQDGTCNGLQHFSAMLRDSHGGAHVNLLPSDTPSDIYAVVAEGVRHRLMLVSEGSDMFARIARSWLQSDLLNREIVKQQVMTVPYGATPTGMHKQLMNKFLKLKNDDVYLPFENEWDAARVLTKELTETISETVVAASTAMAWLQKCAKVVSARGLPLRWSAPHGFCVVQAYRSKTKEDVKTAILGSVKLKIRAFFNVIDRRKQTAGVAPNFVHALDACHMMLTVQQMGEGVSWAIVHDSFGCHAGDAPRLAVVLRSAFVDLYETFDVLANFKADVEADTGLVLPDPPPRGKLDISCVKDAQFFFA